MNRIGIGSLSDSKRPLPNMEAVVLNSDRPSESMNQSPETAVQTNRQLPLQLPVLT
ncbi:hypothetical protein NEIELOOT_00785 [Neisseria elongata subsp. glycolytica ATCC 29315]|uniref:Uncharacterized protein n=1 Tax=Neisseria elongata subsp. glycolytica ATCC 29315 TaxID=546263 RepID=D4DP01_NEIEG|nr:hypothetical protein NEIELOOT_00785 [Neisseria elongata subsp. glycolytica ATCC 29315]